MLKICENCKFFVQHYIKNGNSYTEINLGHCIYLKPEQKKPLEEACENFKKKRSDSDIY